MLADRLRAEPRPDPRRVDTQSNGMPSSAALLLDNSREAGTPMNVPASSSSTRSPIKSLLDYSPTDTRGGRQSQWRFCGGSGKVTLV
jgi:hypothetical protein